MKYCEKRRKKKEEKNSRYNEKTMENRLQTKCKKTEKMCLDDSGISSDERE